MNYLKLKRGLFSIGCAVALVSLPFFVQADTISSQSVIPDFKLQIPIEGLTSGVNIHTYLAAVYRWLMRAAVVFALVMLVIAGIVWMVSRGESGLTKKAHDIIKSTFIGLGLALGSYTILFAVNSNLVIDNELKLEIVKDMVISFDWTPSEESDSVITPEEAAQQDAAAQQAAAGSPSGTPAGSSQGTNGVPLFKQRNYRAYSYGSCGTISSAGCGPTSTAMVMKFYGKNVTPVDVARLFENAGVRKCNGSCSPPKCPCCSNQWHAFTDSRTVGAMGLKGERVSTKNEVLALLRQNKPIVVSVGPSIFTKGGHFIVLTGITPNGDILINDPAKNISQATQQVVFGAWKGAWYIHP